MHEKEQTTLYQRLRSGLRACGCTGDRLLCPRCEVIERWQSPLRDRVVCPR